MPDQQENPWRAGGLHLRGRSAGYDAAMDRFEYGEYEAALELLHSAQPEAEGDPFLRRMLAFRAAEAHARLGRAALEAKNSLLARFHLTSALDLHPGYPDLHYLLSLTKYYDGDLSGALESIDRAIDYNPIFARARVLRGAVFYALGQRDRGITELESALRLDPGSIIVAEALAHHESGNVRALKAALERVLKPGETEVDRHRQLGEDHHRHGRYEEAAAEFLRALDLSPTFADIHNRLGVTLAAAGRLPHALEAFGRALEHNPAYVEALINRGSLLLETGQPAEAASAFRRALELDPENEVARSGLTRGAPEA